MTEDFLTKGFENDRYMKARQLVEQFRDELEVELRAIGEEMVANNPELFDTGVEGDANSQTRSNTYPYSRVDYEINRFHSQNRETNLTLNVHLYWVNPNTYNRKDIDGPLRALGYKIKNVPDADEEHVASRTGDWPLHVTENRFGSKKTFYRHVSSTDEIEEYGEQLVDHFSEFGEKYGVSPENE